MIRTARPADADRLGAVHVRAWQAAYRGVMPDEYLDGLQPADRAAAWRRGLDAPRPGHRYLVVEDEGSVVGFTIYGPEATGSEPPEVGELYAINLDPDVWGRGLGRALLGEVVDDLARLGYAEAVLWVVPANARARALYEDDGWTPDGAERTTEVFGVAVPEMRYRRRLT